MKKAQKVLTGFLGLLRSQPEIFGKIVVFDRDYLQNFTSFDKSHSEDEDKELELKAVVKIDSIKTAEDLYKLFQCWKKNYSALEPNSIGLTAAEDISISCMQILKQ